MTIYNKLKTLKKWTFIVTVSVGQESGHGLAGFSASDCLISLASRCQPGLRSHLETWMMKDLLPRSLTWVGSKTQFLISCWSEAWAPHDLLTRGFSWFLSTEHPTTWQQASKWAGDSHDDKEKNRELARWNSQAIVFCTLVIEVSSHHFSMFCEKQGTIFSPHLQGRGLHRSWILRRGNHKLPTISPICRGFWLAYRICSVVHTKVQPGSSTWIGAKDPGHSELE